MEPDPAPPRHLTSPLRAQPVRTRAQARIALEAETASPLPPHISTSSGVFQIAADEYIAKVRIQIGMGDILQQHTPAIVNPANGHLNHFGGVARARADAAGNDLVNECEACKQTHGLLPFSAAIHTTAGKL